MKRLKQLINSILLFVILLICTNCQNSDLELETATQISDLSMNRINTVVNMRINYLSKLLEQKYNDLLYEKSQNHTPTEDDLKIFFVDNTFVTDKIENTYTIFWRTISEIAKEENIEKINTYITNSIDKIKISRDLRLEQKEILLVEFITAKEFISIVYQNFNNTKSFDVVNYKRSKSFWCGLSIAGNAVATVGLVSCIGTGGLGCAAAVAGKVISYVSIFGSC
ncbi:hypothetical protein [Flavobacterium cerinum]|uniref:Lipoprotein n=1 Tax=Flavobacterium cerinum TaxID=2502784 RepID=A0ABY5IPH9_9FLAO|nr:hypothetical protein [Flavobacterium cerinum]UUC44549.1 hypothetical protein NOX80_13015 [Flavobacterium cerinum]